jgi:hypothetical protein
LFEEAMRHFDAADKLKPTDNEEAVLRWNRCVRLLRTIPATQREESSGLGDEDTGPLEFARRSVKAVR